MSRNMPGTPLTGKTRILLIFLTILIGTGIYFFFIKTPAEEQTSQGELPSPEFQKEGTLTFFNKKDSTQLTSIDIEISETNAERRQGLMYRKSMKENRGMLFIFQRSKPRVFHMKNTPVSLDIIFVNADKEIVTIREHTIPYSLKKIPSGKNARYVVEVKAGFCKKNNIQTGDYISFKRSNKAL